MPHVGERRQIGCIKAGLSASTDDFGDEGFTPIPVAAVHKHSRARFAEHSRHAATDAVGRACNENRFYVSHRVLSRRSVARYGHEMHDFGTAKQFSFYPGINNAIKGP